MYEDFSIDCLLDIDLTNEKGRTRARTLFDLSQSVIVVLNSTGTVTFFNKHAPELLAISEEELLGCNYFDTFTPPDIREHRKSLYQAAMQGNPQQIMKEHQTSALTKQGKVLCIDWLGELLRDESGNTVGVLLSGTDVTERNRAEKELEQYKTQLEGLVANRTDELHQLNAKLQEEIEQRKRTEAELRQNRQSLDLALKAANMGIWHSDERTGEVVRNETWATMLGYKPDDFQSKSLDWKSLIHPEDLKRVAKAKTDMKKGKLGSCDIEYRLKAADGSWRWILDKCDVTKRAEDGSALETAGTHIDITDRKAMEEALIESQARYCNTLNSMAEMVHIINRDYKLKLINSVFEDWLVQYGAPVKLGADIFELMPFLTERVREEYESVFKSGKTLVTEESVVINGKEYVTETRKIPLFKDGNTSEIITIIRDITKRIRVEFERNRLEAELLQADKLKSLGILAGGVAHDFNNLLVVILGNAEIGIMKAAGDTGATSHLKEIRTAAQNAAALCGNLLAISGKGKNARGKLNLNYEITSIASLLKIIVSKRAKTVFELDEHLPPVDADSTQVRQVVMNLIGNAADAMGDKMGEIVLRTGVEKLTREVLHDSYSSETFQDGYFAYLDVTDNGCGMDPETVDSLFTPFFTTKSTGRGLGMASVMTIVRNHGGAIRIVSQKGTGTAVRVFLPQFRATQTVHEFKEVKSSYSGLVALIVEDNVAVRDVARDMLTSIGFDVVTASNGKDALDLFRADPERYAVTIADLNMPIMDGFELRKQITLLNKSAAVVLSSGAPPKNIHNEGCPFLQKPYDRVQLAKVIRDALKF